MPSDLENLMEMLSYRRPMGSQSETLFIDRYLKPLGVERDPHGNLFKVVGGDNQTILWSSHTDTVHRGQGMQRIIVDKGMIKLHKKSHSSCLGADDTAGIWVMMEMIKANVNGLYVFHFGEECGCVGSRALADKSPGFLKGIQAAIAFDRRGTNSIITHQGGRRTASDEFAASLAGEINVVTRLKGMKADSGGIYTDTACYERLIPECTNLSVGYEHAHSSSECLDYEFLFALRDAMLKIDTTRLVIKRDPNAVEVAKYSRGSRGGYQGWSQWANDFDMPATVEDLVYNYPKASAALLESLGFDFDLLDSTLREIRMQSKAPQPKEQITNADPVRLNS